MNITVNNADMSSEVQLRSALIRRCALSPAMIARIRNAEATLGLGFSDAALALELVTREDVNAARVQDRGVTLVPRHQLSPSTGLLLVNDPFCAHSESIRALRTELLLRRAGTGQADCVVVLSPSSGEGRTYLAAELAIAFSQLGKPTLLVDADLRSPGQHRLFGADNNQGLSDALTQDIAPCLHPVKSYPQLAVLTAGSTQHNPLELLSDPRFERLVEEWRRTFSFVVLDTPPIDRYSDGLAVAGLIGRVLMVSRAQHTHFRKTKDLLRRLSATQSQILGAIINNF
jgi:receptor protein-tyrosine kinase